MEIIFFIIAIILLIGGTFMLISKRTESIGVLAYGIALLMCSVGTFFCGYLDVAIVVAKTGVGLLVVGLLMVIFRTKNKVKI